MADTSPVNIGWSCIAKEVYFLEQTTTVGNAIVGGTINGSCFVLGLVVSFGCSPSYNHKDSGMVDNFMN